jgi:hypothetical protein
VKERESDIQTSIYDYLAYRKVFFWRQNTAPTVNKSDDGWSFRRLPKYARRGVPDIIVVQRGRFIGLEVKQAGLLSLFGSEALSCRLGASRRHLCGPALNRGRAALGPIVPLSTPACAVSGTVVR